MTRRLDVVDASDPLRVARHLRAALAGDGPAIVPRGTDAASRGELIHALPREVPQKIALVIETSGSMGAPKRVALSADAVLASVAASTAALGAPGQWLLALPTHYIAGAQVLARSFAANIDPVVMRAGHFDVESFTESAQAMQPDVAHYVSLVPAQLWRLVDAASRDSTVAAIVRDFAGILVGGQALPEPLRLRARGLGWRIVRTYGSTETCGGCVYEGAPIGQVRARTVDGELELSGPALADGYLGDDERTARTFYVDDGARWYRTGDLGAVSSDGLVSVTGRADNVIISGGIKVSLDAVERIVRGAPGFGEAIVVAANDPEWGEVAVVVVTGVERMPSATPAIRPASRDTTEFDRVRARVGERLGAAARPSRLIEVTSLPLLSSGKPDRAAITRLVATMGDESAGGYTVRSAPCG